MEKLKLFKTVLPFILFIYFIYLNFTIDEFHGKSCQIRKDVQPSLV